VSKAIFISAFIIATLVSLRGQEVRPLNESELLKIDGFASGDPLGKQPLSIGDDAPVKRAERAPSKKEKGPTEITANKLDFDQRTNLAIFTGNVVVKDPEFDMTSDKLTAMLKNRDKAAADKVAAAPPPADPPPRAMPEKPKSDSGLEKAIAEGHVIIIQDTVEADGTTSRNTGKSEKAVYDTVTGEITLSGSPEATKGSNKCIALQPDTRLILTRDGKMRAEGPAKFIVQDSPSEKKPAVDKKSTPEPRVSSDRKR